MRKLHPRAAKSRSEDATLFHFNSLPHPYPLWVRIATAYWETKRPCERQTCLQGGGNGGAYPGQTGPLEGRALRLGERSWLRGVIGRTLAEERLREIGPDFQTLGRRCVLLGH
jgi:hypothetical protein